MSILRKRFVSIFSPIAATAALALTLAPFARAEDDAPLAPPATSDVSNEGAMAPPAPDSGGSLDSDPAAAPAEKPAKKSKKAAKHAKKKAAKKKKKGGKKHTKKKHKRHQAD